MGARLLDPQHVIEPPAAVPRDGDVAKRATAGSEVAAAVLHLDQDRDAPVRQRAGIPHPDQPDRRFLRRAEGRQRQGGDGQWRDRLADPRLAFDKGAPKAVVAPAGGSA